MSQKQRTIKKEVTLSGTGLHTGCKAQLVFKPAAEDNGIRFIRTDLKDTPVIHANWAHVATGTGIPRCTSVGEGDAVIHTVEHLLSALCGLGITNLDIEIDGHEIPGMDGSAIDFVKAIEKAGIADQSREVDVFAITEPIGVQSGDSSIYVVPCDEFKISYVLDYPIGPLRSQFFSVSIDKATYVKEIASCRTFCLEQEEKELQKKGLGKGANYQNTLVVGDNGPKENEFRFSDECARHKVLDFIGDLYLLGMPIRGHVYAVKSGHALNIALLKQILQQKKKSTTRRDVSSVKLSGGTEINIDGIMKILPHRYPFLLVDRVIDIERGKRGIGIKNVTANEDFFQGHFPNRPVMPGVLMIEAMAQTAGVVILTNEEHHDKVAFFMAVDNVKFRKVVSPGDQLMMEVEVTRDKPRVAQARAQAKVNGEVVAEAEMTFSFTDASYLD